MAFKLIHDPYVGQQTFIRVYSGEIRSGMQIYNATKQQNERVGRIYKIKAKEREEVGVAGPGDIVALIGMKYTKTGHTLCDPNNKILLESINVPPSVIELKINPKSRKEQAKLGQALAKLTNEDPSFNAKYDEETDENIISGMGELHLEIIVDRLSDEFGVEVVVGEPAVALRETITAEHRIEYRYAKQSGGKGQFAQTLFRMEPNPGNGFEFVNLIKGGNIPQEYIPSVEKGIKKTMASGILTKYPVCGC